MDDSEFPTILRPDPSTPQNGHSPYPPGDYHPPRPSRPLANFDELVYSLPMDREIRAAKDEARYQRRRADALQDTVAILEEQRKVDGRMHLLWSAIAVLVAVLITTLIIFALHQGGPPPPPPGGPR